MRIIRQQEQTTIYNYRADVDHLRTEHMNRERPINFLTLATNRKGQNDYAKMRQ